MPPVRIIQVLGRLDRGGAETMIMNLYRNVRRDLIQFDFVIHTGDECDYSREVRDLGGKVYSMKPFTAANAPGYRRQWRDFFIQNSDTYKIIHGHMRSTAALYLDEAKKAGLITIAHSHNTSSGKGFSALVKNVLQRGIPKSSDYLFSCSQDAAYWLYGKRHWEESRHYIIKNAINPESFIFNKEIRDKKRTELNISGKMILHVGRLEEQKNHRFLLAVMRELAKINKDVMLYLCGTGPLEHELKELVQVYGLSSKVKFLGVRTDVNELMQAADLMLFPSLFEGLPVTLIEAQCTGLDVLMSERVDPTVKITTYAMEKNLSDGPLKWALSADEILTKSVQKQRTSPIEDIIDSGYDCRENSIWLENFYLSLIKGPK